MVACSLEGIERTTRCEGVVHWSAERGLHPRLVEVSDEEVRGERVGVCVRDIVRRAVAVIEVRGLDLVAAEDVGFLADVVDGGVGAVHEGAAFGGDTAAVEELVFASVGVVVEVHGLVVDGFVDRFDAVGVEVRHLGERWNLDKLVDAGIDDAECVEMNVVRAGAGVAVFNFFILLLEECRKGRSVVAPVRLCPNTHAVIAWLVRRELGEPGLRKVPERAGCVLRSIRRLVGVHGAERAHPEGVV